MERWAFPTSNVDDEEYLKYLMFLSEAVSDRETVDTDPTIAVPKLSSLITKARDVTLRPYYDRTRRVEAMVWRQGKWQPRGRGEVTRLPVLRYD